MKRAKKEIIRLGVIGTGRIANRFVPEVKFVNGITVNCVYNPHPCSAEQFAEKHGLNFSASNEKDLLQKVDAVYIASPHHTHYEYVRNALMQEKHVLCEKPLVLKKVQAEELHALAKAKKCVLMEGIKTAYCPGFTHLLDVAESGKIGDIRDVEACFTKLANPVLREFTDAASGGSFTELASYTMLAVIKLLGIQYQELRFESFLAENGVDLYTKAYLKYKNSLATSKTGLGVKSQGQLLISGTKGYIRVDAPWWKMRSFEVCYEDLSQNEKHTTEFLGEGLRYEVSEFVSAINSGENFTMKLSAEESIALAELIEKFLEKRKLDHQ